MKKQFLKIAGVSSEAAFYKKYPTEEAFFAAHPEARKMAMGGTPEAFPQIATFDKAFSYGVPPGPQYLAHGGSAYPQAQTEQQFFVPIYTDVYNPYNKAMGGPNKRKKQQQAEDAAANNVYGKMTFGYPTDAYDEFAGISPEKARDMSGRFDPNSGIDTWSYGNQIYDPGAYANWVNKKLGRQAVMPLQKPFEGPYDVTGRTPNWRNLPDQMDISEPYVDSGIDYRTLTPSNPKNYLYVEPELKMGGSNVEMYPNAKTTPHWGPTNVWFQEGGQEGAPQDGQDLDRLGTLNKTGAFVNNLKQTAAKANAKNAMMSAINNVGMAKYGKQLSKLSKYDPGGATAVNSASTSNNYKINPVTGITPYISQQMSPTSSQFNPTPYFGVDPPSYDQQLLNNMRARGIVYNPNQGQAYYNPYQAQGYNPYATGDMSNFLPSVYDWNNMNQFMFQTKGSPRYKWKTNVPGEGKRRGVSNMDFLNAIFPELYGDTDAQMKALNDPKYADRRKQWGISEITNTPKGIFGKRRQTTIKFGDFAGTSADADAGPSKTPMDMTRKNQPGPLATESSDPIPFTLQDANTQLQQNNPRAKSIMDNLQDTLTVKPGQKSAPAAPSASPTAATPAGTQPNQTGTLPAMLQNNPAYQATPSPNSFSYTVPGTAAQASSSPSYPFPVASSSQRVSQAPSNANSMDAATAQKKAGQMDPSTYINQDYIDAQQAASQQPSYLTGAPYKTQTGPLAEPSAIDFSEPANPYASVMAGNAPVTLTAQPDPDAYLTGAPERVPVGPVVGPEGFAYGGYTGYRYGGSYKQGDVVYMSDDEIAEFIRNGGQIEEME